MAAGLFGRRALEEARSLLFLAGFPEGCHISADMTHRIALDCKAIRGAAEQSRDPAHGPEGALLQAAEETTKC